MSLLKTRDLLAFLTLLVACQPAHLLSEGPIERDPPSDTGTMTDSGEDSGQDTGIPIDREPSGEQVCYPGQDWSYSTCFDLVDWSTDWGDDYSYPEPYQGGAQYSAPARFIDLKMIDNSAALAPNFVVSEFMALRKGRFSIAQVHMVETLQDLRDQSGAPIYIHSGYRSPAYNASVGGVENSRHMFGDSADMTSGALSLEALGALCDSLDASYVGYYETHIHCDWRYSSLDQAFFDADEASTMASNEHSAKLVEIDGKWTATATGFDEGEPLRIWEARDVTGALLHRATARSFEAPPLTASISVLVGGQLALEQTLEK